MKEQAARHEAKLDRGNVRHPLSVESRRERLLRAEGATSFERKALGGH